MTRKSKDMETLGAEHWSGHIIDVWWLLADWIIDWLKTGRERLRTIHPIVHLLILVKILMRIKIFRIMTLCQHNRVLCPTCLYWTTTLLFLWLLCMCCYQLFQLLTSPTFAVSKQWQKMLHRKKEITIWPVWTTVLFVSVFLHIVGLQ